MTMMDEKFPRGLELLHNPTLNKGTAFTEAERDLLGLHGLLPAHVQTLQEQLERVLANLRRKPTALERYIFLIALSDRNETLFYRTVIDNIEEMVPLIYTPDCRTGVSGIQSYFPKGTRTFCFGKRSWTRRQCPAKLAEPGRSRNRGHRRRKDSRTGRSRRQRNGNPDRQTHFVHRVCWHSSVTMSSGNNRCRDKQHCIAGRSALSRLAPATDSRRTNTTACSTSLSRQQRRFFRRRLSNSKTSRTTTLFAC